MSVCLTTIERIKKAIEIIEMMFEENKTEYTMPDSLRIGIDGDSTGDCFIMEWEENHPDEQGVLYMKRIEISQKYLNRILRKEERLRKEQKLLESSPGLLKSVIPPPEGEKYLYFAYSPFHCIRFHKSPQWASSLAIEYFNAVRQDGKNDKKTEICWGRVLEKVELSSTDPIEHRILPIGKKEQKS
jgi:hypothetical protein